MPAVSDGSWRILLGFGESLQFFVGMDFQTVGETEKVLGGLQCESQPVRETALGLQPSLDSKRGFLSKPVSASGSGPTSEITSQANEDDFEDNLQVSTPNQQFEQVLQAQNGVNMASGTAKHNGTLCSYSCAIRSSGHAQFHSRSSGHARCQSRS